MNTRTIVIAALAGGLATTTAYAQMSPAEAQKILQKADAKYHPKTHRDLTLANNFGQLYRTAQQQLRQYAKRCVVIDGELWFHAAPTNYKELMHKRAERMTDGERIVRGYHDADERPIWIKVGHPATTEATIADVWGGTTLDGKVLNIELNGILFSGVNGHKDWFLEIPTADMDIASGDAERAMVKRDGLYKYTTVMGSSRTVRRYKPDDRKIEAVTPAELYNFLREHNSNSLVVYRPYLKLVAHAKFRTTQTSLSTVSRDQISDSKYKWKWRHFSQHINFLKDTSAANREKDRGDDTTKSKLVTALQDSGLSKHH